MRFTLSDFKVLEVKQSIEKEIIDYGVSMSGAPLEWPETMGEGIKVGIIDTGIDLNHVELKNRIKDYVNFSTDDLKDVWDKNGHGTHVGSYDTI